MNKKFLSLFILGLFAVSIFSGVVSADPKWVPVSGEDVSTFINGTVNVLSPFTKLLFGAERSSGENGFIVLAAFLLTVLVIGGVLSPLKIFGNNIWINWGIAAIISLIGTRFISIEMLRSFTLPSEGLIGAIFLIIPFLVVAKLIVTGTTNQLVRRALWVVYGVIVTSLWIKAYNATAGWTSFYLIYIAILVACIVAFAFDGTLQNFLRKAKYGRLTSSVSDDEKRRITARIADLTTAKTAAAGDPDEVSKIDKKIKALQEVLYK